MKSWRAVGHQRDKSSSAPEQTALMLPWGAKTRENRVMESWRAVGHQRDESLSAPELTALMLPWGAKTRENTVIASCRAPERRVTISARANSTNAPMGSEDAREHSQSKQ